VWPVLIIVLGVRLHYMVQLSEAEAEKVIQALTLQTANPRLGVTIGNGRLNRRPDDTAIITSEVLIKGFGKLRVPVMNQESNIDSLILDPHADIPRLLLHPFTRGIVRAR